MPGCTKGFACVTGGFVFFSFLQVACQHEADGTGVGMQLQAEKEPNILLTY